MTVYWNILKASVEMGRLAARAKIAQKGSVREEDIINRALRFCGDVDGWGKGSIKEFDEFLESLPEKDFKLICDCGGEDYQTKYYKVLDNNKNADLMIDDMIHDLWNTVVPVRV